MKSFVFLSRAGCFLPFLIAFNLFFGWIFLKPLHWLVVELALVSIFGISGLILVKKVTSSFPSPRQGCGRTNSIDTEAEVIKE